MPPHLHHCCSKNIYTLSAYPPSLTLYPPSTSYTCPIPVSKASRTCSIISNQAVGASWLSILLYHMNIVFFSVSSSYSSTSPCHSFECTHIAYCNTTLHRVDSQDLFGRRMQPKVSLLASQTCHQFYHGGAFCFQCSTHDSPLLSPSPTPAQLISVFSLPSTSSLESCTTPVLVQHDR